MKLNMGKNKYILKILIAILSIISYDRVLKATPYLMSVYNTTTSATGYTPTIEVAGVNNAIGYSYSSPSVVDKALPVRVSITYPSSSVNGGKPFVIEVQATGSSSGCQGTRTKIEATVLGGNKTHEICIPQTITFDIPGAVNLRWQNVLLAIADNPKWSTTNGELPFRFGISSWTATNRPWNHKHISNPLNNNSITFNPPLNVIQGNAAWGGTKSPRFGFGSIAHIYNNSSYIIMISSDETNPQLSNALFSQLVPPNSVEPFVMAWIPKNKVGGGQSAIKISAMYAPSPTSNKNNQPPPAGMFSAITSTGSSEIALPTTQSVKHIMQNIESSAPSLIETLTGVKSMAGLISNKYSQYQVSKYYFKIFTVNDANKTSYIQRCDFKTHRCTNVQTITKSAFNSFGVPHYFQLILDKDAQFGIKPTIESIPKESALVNVASY